MSRLVNRKKKSLHKMYFVTKFEGFPIPTNNDSCMYLTTSENSLLISILTRIHAYCSVSMERIDRKKNESFFLPINFHESYSSWPETTYNRTGVRIHKTKLKSPPPPPLPFRHPHVIFPTELVSVLGAITFR